MERHAPFYGFDRDTKAICSVSLDTLERAMFKETVLGCLRQVRDWRVARGLAQPFEYWTNGGTPMLDRPKWAPADGPSAG
ncbi:hypothetical protein [Kribbella aluminosa]|nr:hypothetical protein [Kribbella aluminosa]